jgi:GntR family transcriptional regulator
MVGYGPMRMTYGAHGPRTLALVGVDHDSDVPPYQQIAAELRQRIESGELAPRSRLPSVEGLVQEYGVARTTARKALHVLVDAGLARIVTGWGTYVTDRSAS